MDRVFHSSAVEIQLQLSTFKTFLDFVGNHISGKDFSESFDHGWASGTSATAIQNCWVCWLTGVLTTLTNVFSVLHVLVARSLSSAERGSTWVVEWFVGRGCRDMELCLALTAATSSSQVEVAAYLLPHVPPHVLSALSTEILKAVGERSNGSLDGVAFLLHSDFLGDPSAIYDEGVAPQLRAFLQEHWLEAAFSEGLRQGDEHFLNLVKILKWGESPIRLWDLPGPLRVAIAYLPFYREFVKSGGKLLPLMDADRWVGGVVMDELGRKSELMGVLEHHLPPFLMNPGNVA